MKVCKLCNKKSECGEVYYMQDRRKLDRFCYTPRLNPDELAMLHSGTNDVCFNRAQCRKNQGKAIV